MALYIARRLLASIGVLVVLSVLMFVLVNFAGDPVLMLLPQNATQQQVDDLRKVLGLDAPLWVRYGYFLLGCLRGDLGVSFHHGEPALKLVLERLPASLELLVGATLLSVFTAVPFGVLCAVKRGSLVDRALLILSLNGISAPAFWVSIMLVLLFSLHLHWLPALGRGSLAHLVLPSAALALYRWALGLRFIRAGMLDVLGQDYVRTARAKGLGERLVVYKHALRNTLIPYVTIVGLQMGSAMVHAVVVEYIFAWPGMGRLFLESLERVDPPVIIAYAMVTGVIFVVINLCVDLAYGLLDPRVRYS
jgi:ABC-type dipeptide/oligopeptide/nickel transport system permease component